LTTIGVIISLLIGCGALVEAYSHSSLDGAGRFILIFGIIWLIAYWRRWRWFAGVGLLTMIAFSAYGLWIQLSPGLLIIGTLGALSTWDLQELNRRLYYALPGENVREIEKKRIGRLLLLSLVGMVLAGITEIIPMRLTSEVVCLVGILTGIGLILLGRWLEYKRR
jgi:hypothetical protein